MLCIRCRQEVLKEEVSFTDIPVCPRCVKEVRTEDSNRALLLKSARVLKVKVEEARKKAERYYRNKLHDYGLEEDNYFLSLKEPSLKINLLKRCGSPRKKAYVPTKLELSRKFLYGYVSTHPCVDCGESDPIVLEFDHRDPSTKRFPITQITRYSLEETKEEIEKCDVRCANCHRKKTAKERRWYKWRMALLCM